MIIINKVNKNHLFLNAVKVPGIACPLCGTTGDMEMSFYQVQLEAGWVRNTKQITASVLCHHCSQDVPVVRWNEALDHFYKNEKAKTKVNTSFQIGKKGKFLIRLNIIFFSAVILLLAGLFIYYRLPHKTAANESKSRDELLYRSVQYRERPEIGDVALVYLPDEGKQTLFRITAVDTALNIIKAIPSANKTFAPNMTRLSKEEAFSYPDFNTGKEETFSLKQGYENAALITTDGKRLGNVSFVFRK